MEKKGMRQSPDQRGQNGLSTSAGSNSPTNGSTKGAGGTAPPVSERPAGTPPPPPKKTNK